MTLSKNNRGTDSLKFIHNTVLQNFLMSLVNNYYFLIASIKKAKNMTIIPLKLLFRDMDRGVNRAMKFAIPQIWREATNQSGNSPC